MAALLTHAAGNPTTTAVDTTGADLLVAAMGADDAPGSITDSKSNSWTSIGTSVFGPSFVQIWYCLNPLVGTGHTVTGGTSAFISMAMAAFAGTNAKVPATPTTHQNDGTTIQAGALTEAGFSLFCAAGSVDQGGGGNIESINSGFAITDQLNWVNGFRVGVALAYLFGSGTQNPTWTGTTGPHRAAMLTAFPISSSGTFSVRDPTLSRIPGIN